MNFKELFNRLGFNPQNGLYYFTGHKWKYKFSRRVEEIIENKLKPYAIYDLNNEPFILFFENPENPGDLHRWCWNINSSPIIIVIEGNQVKVYNGFSFDNKERFLALLAESEKKIDDFSYLNLVSGKFMEKYGSQFKGTNRVDYKLLENIEAAREILIKEHGLDSSIVNSLIGRIIFVRYLIDRNVRIGNYGSLSRSDFLEILKDRKATYDGLFAYLREKFNGNLFPIEKDEDIVNETHLKVLIRLLKGHELKTGQMNLFEFYDFSVIPIEFISNIYEFFLGMENQKKQGAYYTPPFLVDYILKQTVDEFFERNPRSYECKVLDPACGSGIFLVETLRRLIHRYHELNPGCRKNKDQYKEQLKALLCNNIFGIDKDKNAKKIAIFSLYITLLDYQEPRDIENFQFPILEESNFFNVDFFDIEKDFNKILKSKSLDFIIGNPPWGNLSGETGNNKYLEYCRERGIRIGRKEISQAFLVRTGDFSNDSTHCSLVVTSKNLYNAETKEFREYFLDHFKINQIFELSSVRREVFPSEAIAPAAVIFYRYAHNQDTSNSVVKHISLKPNPLFHYFKIFVIEKYDNKEVLQKYFKDHDWLFKVLVYGNILDFYFIRRLKEKKNYDSINKIIDDKTRFIFGQGAQVGGGDENDASFLLERLYMDTKKKLLQPFFVDLRGDVKWKAGIVHRTREKALYSPPMLLVKKGTTPDYKVVSALCSNEIAFTDSLTSIKAYNKDDEQTLRVLSGLFYSNLFSYYFLATGSSAGIEREQAHDTDEKFTFPFVLDGGIISNVEKIEQNRRRYNQILMESKTKILDSQINEEQKKLQNNFVAILKALNNEIFNAFALSNQEKALVDYILDIIIPLITGKINKKIFKEAPAEILEDYAQLFIKHFKKYFNGPDNYFSVEIYLNRYVVAMNFIVTHTKPGKDIHWKKDEDHIRVVENLTNLSFSEVSNQIFIQKDIKGFEKNSFYVIKPNRYKLWHKALAYLDLNEFSDAVLDAGRQKRKRGDRQKIMPRLACPQTVSFSIGVNSWASLGL